MDLICPGVMQDTDQMPTSSITGPNRTATVHLILICKYKSAFDADIIEVMQGRRAGVSKLRA